MNKQLINDLNFFFGTDLRMAYQNKTSRSTKIKSDEKGGQLQRNQSTEIV